MEQLFGATLKIYKKFNFVWNQQNMHMYQEKNIKTKNSLLFNFGKIWPTTKGYIAHGFFQKMAPKSLQFYITFSDTY